MSEKGLSAAAAATRLTVGGAPFGLLTASPGSVSAANSCPFVQPSRSESLLSISCRIAGVSILA